MSPDSNEYSFFTEQKAYLIKIEQKNGGAYITDQRDLTVDELIWAYTCYAYSKNMAQAQM